MQTFRNNQEPQTVQGYVSTLEERLRRALPRDKAEQITQETHAHLSDRVDDLIDTGLTQAQAEATALSGFGSIRSYAAQAIGSAYSDRNTAAWRRVGRVAVANLLAFSAVHLLSPDRSNQTASLITPPLVTCLGLFLLSSLISRRPQTRQFMALCAIGTLAVGIVAGVNSVPNRNTKAIELVHLSPPCSLQEGPGLVRGDYSDVIAHKRYRLRMLFQETALLRRGMTTYAHGLPVSQTLRIGNRFIVPRPFDTSWATIGGAADISAFKDSPIYDDTLADHEATFSRLPYQTVATQPEAAKLWAERSPRWLAGKERLVDYHTDQMAIYSRALTAAPGFNWGAATYHMSATLEFCALLILVDFVLAHLGRAAWIYARNVRRRRTA